MLPFPEHFLEYPLEVVCGLTQPDLSLLFFHVTFLTDKVLLLNRLPQMIFSLKTDLTLMVLIKVHDRKQSTNFFQAKNKHPPPQKTPNKNTLWKGCI